MRDEMGGLVGQSRRDALCAQGQCKAHVHSPVPSVGKPPRSQCLAAIACRAADTRSHRSSASSETAPAFPSAAGAALRQETLPTWRIADERALVRAISALPRAHRSTRRAGRQVVLQAEVASACPSQRPSSANSPSVGEARLVRCRREQDTIQKHRTQRRDVGSV